MNGSDLRSRPIIEVKDLRKEYPIGDETVVALKRINLNVMRGEICCIFGTSGSGKSTLLNQLAGMEKPTRGQVSIGGVPISRLSENQLASFRQRHLGFVFQSYNLLPNLTATENVAMPLMFRGVPRKQREEAARKILWIFRAAPLSSLIPCRLRYRPDICGFAAYRSHTAPSRCTDPYRIQTGSVWSQSSAAVG